jgi:hypothetical protein
MSRSGVPPQTTPFARLAAAHAVSAAGDAFLTAALAGSLFFTASVSEARGKTILYLCFTMAPFALIAPVIGPFLDRSRGGRKLMVFVTCIGRAFFCVLMALHVDNFLLFPEAFSALVMQKAYSIAKSALVPSVVDDPNELVRANSRLALIAVVGSTVGIIPAAAILKLTDASWVLRFGSIIYLLGALTALQIPRAKAVAPDETPLEKAELHAPAIILASSAMGVLRGAMGFLTFLLAFTLKAGGQPAWFFGLVLGASGAGGFLGAVTAPTLRRRIKEEAILVGALLVPAVVALVCARSAGRPAVLFVALIVAMGAASGKLAFDSLVQRDAPDAARGRTFARFETRFQLVWVMGALLAVVGHFGDRTGFLLLTLGLGFGGLSYLGGVRSAAQRGTPGRRALPPGRPSADSPSAGTESPASSTRPRQSSGVPAELRRRLRRSLPGQRPE